MQEKRLKTERGQAALEFVVILAFFIFLISWLFLAAPLFHISIAVRQAAYDCAFSAVQTLSQEQGYMQGIVAGEQSFDSFGLTGKRATITLHGNWDRGGLVTCKVAYSLPLNNFPLKKVARVPAVLDYSYSLPIQEYKSKWQ